MGWTANGALATAAVMPQQTIVLAASNAMESIFPTMKLNAKTQPDANGAHAGKRGAGITHLNQTAMLMQIVIGLL